MVQFIIKIEKRQYFKTELEKKLIFEYGNPEFSQVCKPGVFHVDRTNFIPLLETSGKVLTFLRPRRFGKTMIVSMLDYYYNILYKGQFKKLFGHLYIGKNPTSERNTFLVFRISFSNLSTMNIHSFERSLNDAINDAVRDFMVVYKEFGSITKNIIVNQNNGISSLTSMTNSIKNSEFRSKVNDSTLSLVVCSH